MVDASESNRNNIFIIITQTSLFKPFLSSHECWLATYTRSSRTQTTLPSPYEGGEKDGSSGVIRRCPCSRPFRLGFLP